MQGIIGFEQHKVSCTIGVLAEEKENPQEIWIDLKVEADFTLCLATDQVMHTVDYMGLANLCTKLAQSKHYHLIETLAAAIINSIFENYAVQAVKICIKKPQALSSAQYTFVEMQSRAPALLTEPLNK